MTRTITDRRSGAPLPWILFYLSSNWRSTLSSWPRDAVQRTTKASGDNGCDNDGSNGFGGANNGSVNYRSQLATPAGLRWRVREPEGYGLALRFKIDSSTAEIPVSSEQLEDIAPCKLTGFGPLEDFNVGQSWAGAATWSAGKLTVIREITQEDDDGLAAGVASMVAASIGLGRVSWHHRTRLPPKRFADRLQASSAFAPDQPVTRRLTFVNMGDALGGLGSVRHRLPHQTPNHRNPKLQCCVSSRQCCGWPGGR